jgi:hypothetical protein
VLDRSWGTMCWIGPGNRSMCWIGSMANRASVLGTYVLDRSWETMCWIGPGKLCVGSVLGNYVLDRSWETQLSMSSCIKHSYPCFCIKHSYPCLCVSNTAIPWRTTCWIGPGKLCVGSVLGNYVLDRSWESMCWIGPGKHSYPCLRVSNTAIHSFVYQTQLSMYQTQLCICTSVPLYTDKYICIYIYQTTIAFVLVVACPIYM